MQQKSPYWNPYLIGASIGALSWAVFFIVDKPLGISTAISQISGAVATPVLGSEAVSSNPYWQKNAPAWDYGTLFLFGTFLGALASSLFSRTFHFEQVPTVWRERFGEKRSFRYLVAFIGGVLTMYGARLAGGCTSGHGISGSLQLAVSSWVFFVVMFLTGIMTARVMFRQKA